MNSPRETQLGHDLHRLASGQPFTPDLAEIKQLARQRHRRGLMRRGATAAGAVVLAAGGLFFGVHGFSGDHGTADTAVGPTASAGGSSSTASATPGQSASGTMTPRLETVAYVAKQVEAALASVNGDIVRDDQVRTGLDNDSGTNWIDSRTGNEFMSLTGNTTGKSLAWLSFGSANGVRTATQVVAEYSTNTWYSTTLRLSGSAPQGSSVNQSSPVMTPAEIKTWVDSGKLKIVGHQSINGHNAIALRGPWALGYREMWVDSQTFLPGRIFVDYYADQGMPSQDLKLTGNLTWLPRTQSLVSMVNDVHVPAGFKQVASSQ